MIKDLFTGSLGKLNNHGGSRIYTTPNTILVSPEYEVDIGEHGDFISCSLDGRLWLFKNKIIALKWNEETGRMEFSASRSFNNNQFIARGIDWILTKTYIIQYNNGKIVVEAHKIKDIQPMENFYSLLPALDGFQIIKGYLIRKPGAEHTDLVYPVNNAGIFLTPNGSEIWGKNSSYAGKITVEKNDNEYKLNVASTYSVSGNITGITFLNDKLYGFQLDGNHKGLCYASQNLNLYFFAYGEWETLSETTGKIYFDVFNKKALALHDKGMEILPDRKKVECNALEQWIAPTKELHYVSNNIIISALSDKVLATNLSLKYYRSLLKADKELSITATAYNSWKLAVGNVSNKLNFNSLNTTPFIEFEPYDIEVELLNVFEHYYAYLTTEEGKDFPLVPYVNGDFIADEELYDNETIIPLFRTDYDEVEEDKSFELPYLVKDYFPPPRAVRSVKISYFHISLDTGEYEDKIYLVALPVVSKTDEEGDLFYTTLNDSGRFYLCKEKNNLVLFSFVRTLTIHEDKYVSQNNIYTPIDYFADNWRKLNNKGIKEFFSNTYINFGFSTTTKKTFYFYCNNDGYHVITEYVLNNDQKELIERYYSVSHYYGYDYYNIHTKNEFAHVAIFSNPNDYKKCLFFVFRTKLKTRSKL